jgi:predicted acyl esterase
MTRFLPAVIAAGTALLAAVAAPHAARAAAGDAISGTASYPALPAPAYRTVATNVAIPMDDGVALGATLTFPSTDGTNPAPGPFPVVLSITPYGRTGLCSCPDAATFASRGIVSAVVDTRGTGGSEGNLNENYFSPREARDGYELVEWLGTRPWSSGRVAMAGGSYVGITQYLTAEQQPPHLVAIAPRVALADLYRDAFTHGGIPNIFFDLQYIGVQGAPGLLTPGSPDQLEMTLRAKVQQLFSTPIALDYLQHPNDDAFYRDRSPIYRAERITVPVLILDGWRDGFSRGAIEMYRALAARPNVETRLYVDACTHKGCGAPFAPTLDPPGLDDLQTMQFEFLSHHLLGTPQADHPSVRTYLQPDTAHYIDATQWPPKPTTLRTYLLHGGAITQTPPLLPALTSYLTNPLAGLVSPLDEYGTIAASPYVPFDQRLAAPFGVVWKTPVLTAPLTLAGPLQLHQRAASTATDTDWIAKVSDVAPDGSIAIISEGYLRASHRELDAARSTPGSPYHTHTDPAPIVPGRFYDYDIGIWPTGYRLAAGHRLQLQVTTYDAPTHAPASFDLTTGAVGVILPSINTVSEGGADPSTLTVPVYS